MFQERAKEMIYTTWIEGVQRKLNWDAIPLKPLKGYLNQRDVFVTRTRATMAAARLLW